MSMIQLKLKILNKLVVGRHINIHDRELLHKLSNTNQKRKLIKIENYKTKEIIQELKLEHTQLNEIIYAAAKRIEISSMPLKKKRNTNLRILNRKRKIEKEKY